MASVVTDNNRTEAVFDALHGHISLADVHLDNIGQIYRITTAPFLQRLRHIKQLGFVSQNFLSAQHSRYAHALGTLHLMRALISQVDKSDLFSNALADIGKLITDDRFTLTKKNKDNSISLLKQHLLVAALVQDVGELPYEKSLGRIFRPGESVRDIVSRSNIDIGQAKIKDIFTLYFIWKENGSLNGGASDIFNGLNKEFLTFLISGLVPSGRASTPALRALRQMVDGTVDADRLDYVYRDAFHTIGVQHRADAVIKSISKYDSNGPVMGHVRPVTDFMITRAALWSNVYLSPENRLKTILLRIVFRDLSKDADLSKKFVGMRLKLTGRDGHYAVTEDEFIQLNDIFIESILAKIKKDAPDMAGNARLAVEILQNEICDYEYKWVPFGTVQHVDWTGIAKLPAGFFWDTYADYDERNHTLYQRRSIRVDGSRYSRLKAPVYLEDCMGPFSQMLQNGSWSALPMPKHMTWFAPHSDWSSRDSAWENLSKFETSLQLTAQLAFSDPLTSVDVEFDTRDQPDFSGPNIFVAFAWEDLEIVQRVLSVLIENKRRYFVLLDGRSGFAGSPVSNSEVAVNNAEAVLILASSFYVERYKDKADGPIHAEVDRMVTRKNEIPVITVGVDSHEIISKETFPWSRIAPDGLKLFTGSGLRDMSSVDFRSTVENALKSIDDRLVEIGRGS